MAGCPCLSLHKLSRKVSKLHEKIFYYCGNDKIFALIKNYLLSILLNKRKREKKIGKCESFETAAHEIETESLNFYEHVKTTTKKSIPQFFHQTSPFYDYEKSLWRLCTRIFQLFRFLSVNNNLGR